jgi:uncharacterized membrane protein YkvA (DUF1232 family)
VKDVLLATIILIAIAFVIVALVAAFVAWKVLRSDGRRLARRIGKLRFRDKIAFVRDVMRDKRVPWWSKLIAGALVVYLASPIDLIPDFIPVLGQLDDLAMALIVGGLLLRSVPREVIEEHLATYEAAVERGQLPESDANQPFAD